MKRVKTAIGEEVVWICGISEYRHTNGSEDEYLLMFEIQRDGGDVSLESATLWNYRTLVEVTKESLLRNLALEVESYMPALIRDGVITGDGIETFNYKVTYKGAQHA